MKTVKIFTILFFWLFYGLANVQLLSAAVQINIPGPSGSSSFGSSVTALPNGNIVVVDSDYGTNFGAVYLYNGSNGALISVLKGDRLNDRISNFGIVVLPNGNYVVISPNWHDNTGAVTFCDKTTGCNGLISTSNSLIGSSEGAGGDFVGYYGVTVLPGGNYVVNSPRWSGQRGAVTWGNGQTGVKGVISAANSLVGVVPSDHVGTGANYLNGTIVLSTGHYVVISAAWNDNRGAATFCNSLVGCAGNISSSNSLVGTKQLDSVGIGGIVELTNGNYLVRSYLWSSDTAARTGAITWGSGTSGVTGQVSVSNSLTGTINNEQISNTGTGVVPLTNGNYVVLGPRGATFGNGTTGTSGEVSALNSLVGTFGDDFSSSRVYALANGNYVVVCPSWDLNSAVPNAGAVTLGNGVTGTTGIISPSNSLVGNAVNNSIGSGGVVPLTNGNYVVRSGFWNSSRGAVTWADGTTGIVGTVSESNSLVGATPGDRVGEDGVTALTNGNYVVSSSDWDNNTIFNAGAVTFGNGTTGITGIVTTGNSLVGTRSRDEVGSIGVVALPNGNYVVQSPEWNEYRGAATFGNGITGITGEVSAANSLVGSNPNDYVSAGFTLLANGNYVVFSHNWNGVRGAVTFANASTGIRGEISASNSLIGSAANDRVSSGNNLNGVTPLPNGNYVIQSPNWNGDLGAVTFGNGVTGTAGIVSPSNSLVGTTQSDLIGNGSLNQKGITVFSNSRYAVFSPGWDNSSIINAGAVSLGKANAPISGEISNNNSVLGTTPNYGSELKFSYDNFNDQIVVGDRGGNKVTIFRYENTRTAFDFDGDGRTDIGIFRPGPGEWWLLRSSDDSAAAVQFGSSTDAITPSDYTGDGRADIAFFRPSEGSWYILRSEDNSFYAFPFGSSGDIPVPADYDGDGRTDAAVFRGLNQTWYISKSTGGIDFITFGAKGDVPVVADYDGDGKSDLAITRVNGLNREWWIRKSSDNQVIAASFGAASDKPVQEDYTGDGRADIAFFKPSTGYWYILRSEDASYYAFPFGTADDIPAPGDYDGDSRADAVVFRPSNSTWYLQQTTNGFSAIGFGIAGDIPVPSAYLP